MGVEQLTSVEGMSPVEIARATREGRLVALLSGDPFGVEAARAEVMKAKADAAATSEPEAKHVSPDQGARGARRSDGQVTATELATMSAEEITKATRQGRMADLLG
jgi:hypothetical protein